MPDAYRIVIEKNERIVLRDGVVTYADVYRPLLDRPVPVVVTRTAYDKEGGGGITPYPPQVRLAEAGYAVVMQDIRGRFTSEGTFYPFVNETDDGYDTVEWAATQPWSSGSVALMGASYLGATTMLGARSGHTGLKAVVPTVTTDEYYETWNYHGGALQLGFAGTWAGGLAQSLAMRPDTWLTPEQVRNLGARAVRRRDNPGAPAGGRTPRGVAGRVRYPGGMTGSAHPDDDEYWQAVRVSDSFGSMDVAGLHLGGWFDIFLAGTIRNFVGPDQGGPRSPEADSRPVGPQQLRAAFRD